MPFAAKPMIDDPNDLNKNQGQGGTNISGGAGANFSTGVPGQEGGKDKKSSGNYANIQSYLDANKDQGDAMGQQVASGVESKAQDATQKINDFSQKAPSVAAYDPNEAYSKLGNLSDQEKTNYRTQKETGGYTGPQQIDQVEGYFDTQKAASAGSAAVKNAGNEYGQQQLLKDTYGRPQYSAGENRLDQTLLQNSAGSRQALEGVTSRYKDLDSMFNTKSQQVGGAINAANTQALANKNAFAPAEANQWKSLVDPIQARADQMNIDNPALIQRITDDTSDNTLNQETLDRLGLSEGSNTYGLNLSSYLNPNPLASTAGLNNAANAQDRSRYQALADLVQDPTRTQITADGKGIDPVSFNKEKFDKDSISKKAELEDIVNNKTMYRSYNGSANATIQQALDQIQGNIARGSNVEGNQQILADILKQQQEAREAQGLNTKIQKGQ